MVTYLPSSAQTSITIEELEVSTDLTISAPISAVEGESFSVSGILVRVDTGEPIPNQTISITYNGTAVGSGTTGVDGDYLITISIPDFGTYTLTAEFAGVSGLRASEARSGISVGFIEMPNWLNILVPLIVGTAVYKLGGG
ncbi:hypothetical protein AKJ59_00720 [candidate division MSBL1 archaeon SCGC-AAA385M02]|uniref:Bacterial Ig-like domain-containing protein n=1 Tax=candidate division MSBL1 archaeon SCGC-AAA385M02 TaxID=1698287 RepID=A0A133VQ87_9EURY|nr:hypothetical protein AKJ59_00720 [candidate division MSBL1 archaeon SCGC-AAA385M02]